jgi:membrane protein DedA with SNARE-associated domain
MPADSPPTHTHPDTPTGLGKLQLAPLAAVFLSSAILGDAVNYAIGNRLGRVALAKGIIKQQYIDQTEKYYAKYGGKTVVLARWVAGVGVLTEQVQACVMLTRWVVLAGL